MCGRAREHTGLEVASLTLLRMDERTELRLRWMRMFQESSENDSWGQVIEALEGYDKYARNRAINTRVWAI